MKNKNYRTADLADLLGCSRRTVCRYIDAGLIPAFKRPGSNGHFLIPESAFRAIEAAMADAERAGDWWPLRAVKGGAEDGKR